MLQLVMCGSVGSDSTAPYDVILDKAYTVRTFIDAVLSQRNTEWGYIGIDNGHSFFGKPCCEYQRGSLLSEMNRDVLDKPVISVKASGGYTRMDYLLKV